MENDGNICYAMSRSSLFDFPLKILNNFLCMQSQQLMLRSDMLIFNCRLALMYIIIVLLVENNHYEGHLS